MPDVHGLVDHLFRREAGRMVAVLTRSFGPARLELAEEVVQEALVQALRRWPFHGVPDNPRAWLYRVARNQALDRMRRDATVRDKEPELRERLTWHQHEHQHEHHDEAFFAGELDDDRLRLVFLCCHPDLPRDARVALTLKTVCGFSVPEIARAFLTKAATIAQRLVRAQRRIKERQIPFEIPAPEKLPERLEAVLEVVYLTFNEGYAAHGGDRLVRRDLMEEARRLAAELSRLATTARPSVHALAALLAFQSSREPARLDVEGNLVVLDEQDRSLWDRSMIRSGFAHLERAASGGEVTVYHVQAAIAAHHAMAPSAEATNWAGILALYDELLELNPSPVVALNRAVALARLRGPRAGLAALAEIADEPSVQGYYLLPATRADLLVRSGDLEGAAASFRRALACPCSEPERRFLGKKLERLEARSSQLQAPSQIGGGSQPDGRSSASRTTEVAPKPLVRPRT